MIEMHIKAETTYENVELFKYLCDLTLNHYVLKKAEIRYNRKRLNDENDPPEKWTLQLYYDRLHISVYGLTSGYNGSGPSDLKEILDYCGFKSEETNRVFSEESFDLYK